MKSNKNEKWAWSIDLGEKISRDKYVYFRQILTE